MTKIKGMTEIDFLYTYVAFLLFIVYVSGMASVSLLNNVPTTPPSTVSAPSITDILAPFGFFLQLITVSPVASEVQLLFTLILTPAIVVLVYIIIKALPFT